MAEIWQAIRETLEDVRDEYRPAAAGSKARVSDAAAEMMEGCWDGYLCDESRRLDLKRRGEVVGKAIPGAVTDPSSTTSIQWNSVPKSESNEEATTRRSTRSGQGPQPTPLSLPSGNIYPSTTTSTQPIVETPSIISTTPKATPAQGTNNNGSASGGLSQGAKIGLGVGLGVGVSALLALIAILCIVRRRKRNHGSLGAKYMPQTSEPSMIEAPRAAMIPAEQARASGDGHYEPAAGYAPPQYQEDQSRHLQDEQYDAPVSYARQNDSEEESPHSYEAFQPPPRVTSEHEIYHTPISAVTPLEPQYPSGLQMGTPPTLNIPHTEEQAEATSRGSWETLPTHRAISPISPVSPVSAMSGSRPPSPRHREV